MLPHSLKYINILKGTLCYTYFNNKDLTIDIIEIDSDDDDDIYGY